MKSVGRGCRRVSRQEACTSWRGQHPAYGEKLLASMCAPQRGDARHPHFYLIFFSRDENEVHMYMCQIVCGHMCSYCTRASYFLHRYVAWTYAGRRNARGRVAQASTADG